MIKGKGFAITITIWSIDYTSMDDNIVIGHEYFLSFKRAKKYMEKREQELKQDNIKMAIGGEDLWLW